MDDKRVYIMDVYNRGIYPHDGYAKRNALICLYNITSHITFDIKFKEVFFDKFMQYANILSPIFRIKKASRFSIFNFAQ